MDWRQLWWILFRQADARISSRCSPLLTPHAETTVMTSRLEKLQSMLADDPQDSMLRYMVALELEKEGNNAQSLELLQGLMSDATPYVPAFVMAGQQLTGLGRADEARMTFREGIEQARQQGDEHAAGEMNQFLLEIPSDS